MIDLKKLKELGLHQSGRKLWIQAEDVVLLIDQIESAQRDAALYRVYDEVIAEIDRRAEKEWCLSEKCDFTVTITYEQYRTIAAAMNNT